MKLFPRKMTHPKAPPIKSQGIKTKLVPFILRSIQWDGEGRWIEPFFGSGAVLFNAAPDRAVAADANCHLIAFYHGIQRGIITPSAVREFLECEGDLLQRFGEEHYYVVRERFNSKGDPFDFLFLNRSCFNGMIRFNSKGQFNVPFCRKIDRFRTAYITKICNQVAWVRRLVRERDWEFIVQDWSKTLKGTKAEDFVYVDPPYLGRHTDYYNSWTETDADRLASRVRELPCGFAFSMWYQNKYRENIHIDRWFPGYPILTEKHFYHVGSKEKLRNEMVEALIIRKGSVAEDTESTEINAYGQISFDFR